MRNLLTVNLKNMKTNKTLDSKQSLPNTFDEVLGVLNRRMQFSNLKEVIQPNELNIIKIKWIFEAFNNISGYEADFSNSNQHKYTFYGKKRNSGWSVDDDCYCISPASHLPNSLYVSSHKEITHIIKHFESEIIDYLNS